MPPNQEDSEPARRAALRAASRGHEVEEWAGHVALVRGTTVATRFSSGEDGTFWFDYDPEFAETFDYYLATCGTGGLWYLFPRAFLADLATRTDATHPTKRPQVLSFSIHAPSHRLTYGPSPAPKPFVLRFCGARIR